jgi:hypothetical protein
MFGQKGSIKWRETNRLGKNKKIDVIGYEIN